MQPKAAFSLASRVSLSLLFLILLGFCPISCCWGMETEKEADLTLQSIHEVKTTQTTHEIYNRDDFLHRRQGKENKLSIMFDKYNLKKTAGIVDALILKSKEKSKKFSLESTMQLEEIKNSILNIHNEFLKLEDKPPISPDATEIKNLNITAKSASAIYEIKGKKQNGHEFDYIVKFYFKKIDFSQERRQMNELESFVKNKCNKNPLNPHFIKYKGPPEGEKENNILFDNFTAQKDILPGPFIIMTKAEGITLARMLRLYTEGSTVNEISLFTQLHYIGRKIGNFHIQFGELDEISNIFICILHNDLNLNNILYSDLWNQVWFIDYASMHKSLKKKKDISIELLELFFWDPGYLRRFCLGQMVNEYLKHQKSLENVPKENYQIQICKIKEDLNTLYQLYLHRIDLFLNTLKEGYMLAFKDHPHPTLYKGIQDIIDQSIQDDVPTSIDWDGIS